MPSPGEIERFRAPMGAGIRNDVGVADGSQITSHYDSMLSKVIVHASTRAEAVTRLKTALSRYAVVGVTTNIDFLRWIMEQEDFVRGRATTDFLDRLWWPREPSPLVLRRWKRAIPRTSSVPGAVQIHGGASDRHACSRTRLEASHMWSR